MTIDNINTAIKEAQRFISVALKAKDRISKESLAEFGCKETGACRRASMDLTRALTELRKS